MREGASRATSNQSRFLGKTKRSLSYTFPIERLSIDSKVRDVIPIPGILADLEINLDEEFWRKAT